MKRLMPELKGLEAERDGWKTKYEEQRKTVENLENFQRALEIQVLPNPSPTDLKATDLLDKPASGQDQKRSKKLKDESPSDSPVSTISYVLIMTF
jgi:hypothetical protein